MRKVGLLGCGNIGGIIAGRETGVEIVAVFDTVPGRAVRLARKLPSANVHGSFEEFVGEDFDTLVEAASIGAVEAYGETILRRGKNLILLSVGALADRSFRERLVSMAAATGKSIRIPSGALFGLDNLKIGRVSRLDRLILRTTKSPASLGRVVEQRTLLFKGSAQDCIKLYPRNVNVAVALSLAADREVDVELWADPAVTRNSHQIVAEGEFGEVSIAVQNLPSPDNPATSYLAALSIIALLKNLDNPLKIGT